MRGSLAGSGSGPTAAERLQRGRLGLRPEGRHARARALVHDPRGALAGLKRALERGDVRRRVLARHHQSTLRLAQGPADLGELARREARIGAAAPQLAVPGDEAAALHVARDRRIERADRPRRGLAPLVGAPVLPLARARAGAVHLEQAARARLVVALVL